VGQHELTLARQEALGVHAGEGVLAKHVPEPASRAVVTPSTLGQAARHGSSSTIRWVHGTTITQVHMLVADAM
jgi:hypothetical protein